MSTTNMNTERATLSNHLNLDEKKMRDLNDQMNDLLSDYHVFYQNVRGFHWNVKGADFFILHEKFEELYTQLYQNIDDLAERIITIGYKPLHSYSKYLSQSIHKEVTDVSGEEETVVQVIKGLGVLSTSHRKVAQLAGEIGDIVTEDMLTNFVADLEKRMWMFTMYKK